MSFCWDVRGVFVWKRMGLDAGMRSSEARREIWTDDENDGIVLGLVMLRPRMTFRNSRLMLLNGRNMSIS